MSRRQSERETMRKGNVPTVWTVFAAVCLSLAVLGLAACGGDDQTSGPTPDSQAPQASPAAIEIVEAPTEASSAESQQTGVESPTPAEAPTDAATLEPTEAPPSPTPEVPEVIEGPRKTGEYENINFVVSEGSEATFTWRKSWSGCLCPTMR